MRHVPRPDRPHRRGLRVTPPDRPAPSLASLLTRARIETLPDELLRLVIRDGVRELVSVRDAARAFLVGIAGLAGAIADAELARRVAEAEIFAEQVILRISGAAALHQGGEIFDGEALQIVGREMQVTAILARKLRDDLLGLREEILARIARLPETATTTA